ncbi:hypothetical protein ACUOFC_68475, partial [Escherichia sp. TWPC-MK]
RGITLQLPRSAFLAAQAILGCMIAQIPLGQPIHFVQCSLEEALKARQDQQRYFEQLAWRLHNEN